MGIRLVARVAIVEDEPSLRELYCLALKSGGYDVAFVSGDGADAVRQYAEAPVRPDLVIMDVRMPGSSGVDAARQIQAIDTCARVLFATADGDLAALSTISCSVGILQKPFMLKSLITAIDLALTPGDRNSFAGNSPKEFA